MSQQSPSASTAAQRKSHVTYTAPNVSLDSPQFTLLEAPSLLGSSGTTGFRTWEAALFLGTYLTSAKGRYHITQRNIVEIGAGTGFLSIMCAKHLGARRVLATDGSLEVVNDLKNNIHLNGLKEDNLVSAHVLRWGHTLLDGAADIRGEDEAFDLAIGADVTYDIESIPSLVATISELFVLYPNLQVLISATVRNEATLRSFVAACSADCLSVKEIGLPMIERRQQTGFFFPTHTPIKILAVWRQ